MKERLVQLLDLEQLSPSKFADIIGVQRSSISHVLSGRNKPSFDFLQKTLTAFPGLNADWLIQGEGTMYEHMGREMPGTLFDVPEEPQEVQAPDDKQNLSGEIDQIGDSGPLEKAPDPLKKAPEPAVKVSAHTAEPGESLQPGHKKKIVQVMVFYDDDTFRSFEPSQ